MRSNIGVRDVSHTLSFLCKARFNYNLFVRLGRARPKLLA
jgi:hypothetical protein